MSLILLLSLFLLTGTMTPESAHTSPISHSSHPSHISHSSHPSHISHSSPCDTVPPLNKKIVSFVHDNLNKKVGRGECWDLAAQALNTYKAKWNGKLTYGRVANYKTECIYPGDIIQFENVMTETVSANGRFIEQMPHHTAVVYEVHGKGHFTIAHQNYQNKKKVILTTLKMDSIKKGKAMLYRPQA